MINFAVSPYCLIARLKTERSREISPRPRKSVSPEQNVALARRTIIEAARALFVERGFTTHRSMTSPPGRGVSRATCYYQLKSKNGRLDAVVADAQHRAPVTLRSRIRHPATQPRPADDLRGLIRDICLIWEQDRTFLPEGDGLRVGQPELPEVTEVRKEDRSLAIDAISHRLIARYSRRASVEALWALTSFPVFDSIRRHTSLDEAVEMLAEMAVRIVDPEKLWQLPQRGDRDG